MKKAPTMPSTPNVPTVPSAPVCQNLRWKGRAGDSDPGEQRFAFARNQVPYTCLRTCQPWGPDDEPAVPEGCDAARPCFEGPPLRDS